MYLYLCRIAWLDRLTQICFAFCFHFDDDYRSKYFECSWRWYFTINVMYLSLSYCMVGSSPQICFVFCFLFFVLTMMAVCKYFQCSWRWYFTIKVMYLYLCRIAWLDHLTQICFVFFFGLSEVWPWLQGKCYFWMLVTMVFHHQSDVSLSLSYCMLDRLTQICFVFSFSVIVFNDDCRV